MNLKVLFLIHNKYPDGDAGAIRQHSLATILKSIGYEVTILCLNQSESIGLNEYEGISYLCISGRYLECKKQLKQYLSMTEIPDVLILNSIPYPAFCYAKKYALKHNVQLLHDCVEWFSLDEFSLKDIDRLIRCYLATTLVNRFKLDKNFKIISISSYLDSYFKNKGIKSVRIPVIMNTRQIEHIKQAKNNKLYITYAGSPSGKDYLSNIISAIELLDETERERICFTILGVNQSELSVLTKKSIGSIEKLTCVTSLGKVPRETVLERLKYTDFTILIRSEKARYAKAGFPTKVVESLASATPVILNFTSDLKIYLRDGHDCLKVSSENPQDILVALRRALALSTEDKEVMQHNARKTAEDKFDINVFRKTLHTFIKNDLN